MPSIKIDLSEVIAEFSLGKEQVQALTSNVLEQVTQAVHRQWSEEARRTLKSTRANYVRSLFVVPEGRLKNTIILRGALNNMIESGASGFDMKMGFSKSAKVKVGKNGNWYLTIPFRMGIPSTLGESDAFNNIMPKPVYNAIRRVEKAGRSTLQKVDLPKAFAQAKTNANSGYTHKSSIYEGLKKTDAFYSETTKQGQYNTFRRVGLGSNSRAFLHPGFQPQNFADKAISNAGVDIIVDNAVDEFVEQLDK